MLLSKATYNKHTCQEKEKQLCYAYSYAMQTLGELDSGVCIAPTYMPLQRWGETAVGGRHRTWTGTVGATVD